MSGPFVDQATDSKRWYLADISRPDGTFNDALPKSPFIYHRSSLAGKGITIHVLDSGCNMDATVSSSFDPRKGDHHADIMIGIASGTSVGGGTQT
jgi:hypothetical protein